MSRVAKMPVPLPKGVQFSQDAGVLTLKGPKGELRLTPHALVRVERDGDALKVAPANGEAQAGALAGTTRALLSNMVQGVSQGFERKLELAGVGYRAQAQGKVLSLSLGYSHPVNFDVPAGITIETPSQTEIVVRGADKQMVGQVAAVIRSYRPPEPYKGKGVKYAGENILRKEAKKK